MRPFCPAEIVAVTHRKKGKNRRAVKFTTIDGGLDVTAYIAELVGLRLLKRGGVLVDAKAGTMKSIEEALRRKGIVLK